MESRLPPRPDLLSALCQMPSYTDLTAFLSQLCLDRELKLLQSRWEIAKLLHMGFSYRIIREKTGASSATISRTKKMMGTREFDLALRLHFESLTSSSSSR